MNSDNNNLNSQSIGSVNLGTINVGNVNSTPVNNNVVNPIPVEPVINNTGNTIDSGIVNGEETFKAGSAPVPPVNNVNVPPVQTSIESVDSLMDEPVQKPKKKSKFLPILLVIILLLALAGCAYYFYFRNIFVTPKKVFETSITALQNKIETLTSANTSSGSVKLVVTPSTDIPFSKVDALINYQTDISNKVLLADILLNYKDGKVINASLYSMDNKTYLKSSDLFDGFLYEDNETDIFANVNNQMDIASAKKVVNYFLEASKTSLKDEYFTKTKDGDLTKNTLNLSDRIGNKYLIDIFTTLKNNNDFIKNLALYSGADESDVTSSIETFIDDIETSNNDVIGEFSIYTSMKNEISKAYIKLKDDTTDIILNIDSVTKNGFNYNLVSGSDTISGVFSYSFQNGETKSNISAEMKEYGKIELELNNKNNVTLIKPTISDAKKIDELSPEIKESIITNISSSEGTQSLMGDLSNNGLLDGILDRISGSVTDLPSINNSYCARAFDCDSENKNCSYFDESNFLQYGLDCSNN